MLRTIDEAEDDDLAAFLDCDVGNLLQAVHVARERRDDDAPAPIGLRRCRASTSPIWVSDSACARLSALVESASSSRTPSSRANRLATRSRSVRRPSTGKRVDLEVARVHDHPLRGAERRS